MSEPGARDVDIEMDPLDAKLDVRRGPKRKAIDVGATVKTEGTKKGASSALKKEKSIAKAVPAKTKVCASFLLSCAR